MSDERIERLKTEIEKVDAEYRTATVRYYIGIGGSDEAEARAEYNRLHGLIAGLEVAIEIMEGETQISYIDESEEEQS